MPGWEVKKEQGKQLIDAAEANDGNGLEIKLGGDPIYAAQSQSSPEGLGFLGAAIVLLIAFGSVVAAGLPLAIALIGLGISSGGLIALLANVMDVPDWTTAVSGLIGIGVGIDYSLLVLTRFRSALDEGKSTHDAVVESVTTAGRSAVIAGLTVVVAVLGLCLTGLSYMYGVAISTALAVLVVMAASISLLPALLAYLGPRVDRLRIPLLGRRRKIVTSGVGESPAARWSHAVQRRPWLAAIAATAVLLALAAPALGMRLGFPDAGNDPPDTMTRQAYDLNTEGFGARHERTDRDRRRHVQSERQGRGRLVRPERARGLRRGLRDEAAHQLGRRRRPDHRHPEELAPGPGRRRTSSTGCATTPCPRSSAAAESPPRSAA